MFRPIHSVIFRSVQLYVRAQDNYCFVVTYSWACWDFKT